MRLLRTNSPIQSTMVWTIAGWPWRTQSTARAPATAYKETTFPQVTPSKKINDMSNNSPSFPHSAKKNTENLDLFIYFVHLIGYWSLSELHMGTAGNTPRWVASLLQGPMEHILGIGYLAQGYLGSALLPLLLAHIPSFVCNLCLPGLRPRTLHFPAPVPLQTELLHTIYAHNLKQDICIMAHIGT